MPIITLEVLSNQSITEPNSLDDETKSDPTADIHIQDVKTGIHFLTEKSDTATDHDASDSHNKDDANNEVPKARDLLEYMMRNDGSVVCKLCGEILQSRTHWYRHKYKLHVIPPLNPAPLFQCEQCLVYFKSRKGYIGHLASRHSEILADSSPVLTNSQAEAITRETPPEQLHCPQEVKHEPDPELSIPKSSVPNYQTTIIKQLPPKTTESKRPCRSNKGETSNRADWEEKRSREEKLVADIIDRVRRECEAQGSGGATRRGYTRRTTVMHT